MTKKAADSPEIQEILLFGQQNRTREEWICWNTSIGLAISGEDINLAQKINIEPVRGFCEV